MKRMILTLPDTEKAWLAHESQLTHRSIAQVIRDAIASYREARLKVDPEPDLKACLKLTQGTWSEGEALRYQERLRSEWDERL